MNLSIAFSGQAGTGINTCGILLGKFLSSKGYFIIGDKEYSSVIKGGNNIFVLYISDKQEFLTNKIDIFVSFDDYGFNKNSEIYNIGKVFDLKEIPRLNKNIFSIGLVFKLLGFSLDDLYDILSAKFKGEVLEKVNMFGKKGFDYQTDEILNLNKNIGKPRELLFGNEVVANGAMQSGLEFYSAYPMTPASTLIDVINKNPEVIFFQGEDEIAVSMAMLGAKFAGKRSMCGTSGGGFALMTESIGFSNQAEIGGVYILSQRDGPSTGTPTFTGQADLNYALNASFGDTLPIVVAPSDYHDGYNLIGKALNWSDIYQHPIIYLVDKQFSESYVSTDKDKLTAEKIDRGLLETNPGKDYKRYKFNKDGISPYTIPGTPNGEFMATSYEHGEYGETSEDKRIKKLMMEKRFQKLETFVKKEFNDNFFGYEIINETAKNFFVTFGFNHYVLKNIVDQNKEYGLINIKVLQPIDMRLRDFLENNFEAIDQLIFVEMNYIGQLENLISSKLGLKNNKWEKKVRSYRKYDLYPIWKEDIEDNIF